MIKRKSQLQVVLGCVIANQSVLLIRRQKPSMKELHNRFELPGGKLWFGEAPERAVEREVLEETGVRVEADYLIPFPYSAVREGKDERIHVVVLCYRCKLIDPNSDFRHLSDEGGTAQWMPLAELDPVQTQSGSFQFVRYALEREGQLRIPFENAPTLHYINLESVDPSRNRQRGYRITLEANLSGAKPFKVTAYFGRIPTLSNQTPHEFESRDAALGYVNQLLMARARHSYSITEISDGFPYTSAQARLPCHRNQETLQERLF